MSCSLKESHRLGSAQPIEQLHQSLSCAERLKKRSATEGDTGNNDHVLYNLSALSILITTSFAIARHAIDVAKDRNPVTTAGNTKTERCGIRMSPQLRIHHYRQDVLALSLSSAVTSQ